MRQLTKGTQKTEILLSSLFISSAQGINDEKIYYLPYLHSLIPYVALTLEQKEPENYTYLSFSFSYFYI